MDATITKKTAPTWIIRGIITLVIAASFWFVYRELDKNQVQFGEAISSAGIELWLGGAIIVAMMVIWPVIWMIMMRGCGAKMHFRESCAIWWTTNIAKYVPGKVSLIAGRAWVARKWGAQVVVECFAWELILSTSSALIAGCLLLTNSEISLFWKMVLGVLALFSLLPLINLNFTQKILRKPIAMVGKGEWDEPVTMTRRYYLFVLSLMIVSWGIWGIAHKMILEGIGVDVSLSVLIAVFAISWMAGFYAFFLPAGFGVREGSLTYLLNIVVSGGVGAILAIISRTFNVIGEIIAFFIGASLLKGIELDNYE